jgi:hypothetical protein
VRVDLRSRLVALVAGLSDEWLARLERGCWRAILLTGLAIAVPARFNPHRAAGMRPPSRRCSRIRIAPSPTATRYASPAPPAGYAVAPATTRI